MIKSWKHPWHEPHINGYASLFHESSVKHMEACTKLDRSDDAIVEDTPSDVMIICAKYGKNAIRIVDFFQGESQKNIKIYEKLKF